MIVKAQIEGFVEIDVDAAKWALMTEDEQEAHISERLGPDAQYLITYWAI